MTITVTKTIDFNGQSIYESATVVLDAVMATQSAEYEQISKTILVMRLALDQKLPT